MSALLENYAVTFAVRVSVGARQPETGIRREIADALREQAERLENGEFQVPIAGQERDVVAGVCSFVHTYKGEGLTACGLEVVGPCPDCERATS